MKVPISWLKEYLDFSLSPQELADVLTLAGMEVDSIEHGEILEISLTPNLGHCMSIYGLARELSALLDTPLKKPDISFPEEGKALEHELQVTIVDRKQCVRYACRLVRDVHTGPSPDWLKRRLEASGIRSINNVVDVSNFVMLLWGQPLHFFDYDKMDGNKVVISSQTAFSTLETLDGVARIIPPDALIICDGEKPIAFAGVMGGKETQVSEATKNVLIESACFTPQAIRKSSRWLGLRTEAVQHFEKGTDPHLVIDACNYAAALLHQICGGKVAPGIIDEKVHAFLPKKIVCRISRVNALLGTQLSLREVALFLTRLGMRLEEKQNELLVWVPTYRYDVHIEEDLIEDVARLYGYNHIPRRHALYSTSTIPNASSLTFESQMRECLIKERLQEFLNCDLISFSQEEMLFENTLSKESCLSVLHSKSEENSVLRTSLLAGLLQVVKFNIDRYQRDISGFEVGRIYFKEGEIPKEKPSAAIILTGKKMPHHWSCKSEPCDFFDLKGIVENIFEGLRIANPVFEPSHLHNFHPNRQAHMKIGEEIVGVIGEIHPRTLEKCGIEQRVFFCEWDLQELLRHIPEQKAIVDSPIYPGSERDLTLTLKEEIPIARVFEAIYALSSPLLERVTLLDLYKSDQIGKDKKNATFRFFYRDPERTLAFESVEKEHARIISTLCSFSEET